MFLLLPAVLSGFDSCNCAAFKMDENANLNNGNLSCENRGTPVAVVIKMEEQKSRRDMFTWHHRAGVCSLISVV